MQLEDELNRAIEKNPENKKLRMIKKLLDEVFIVENNNDATNDGSRKFNESEEEEAIRNDKEVYD